MAIEDEGGVFKSAFLEDNRVPWRGLGASVLIHSVLLPVLAIGLEEAARWPTRIEEKVEQPLIVHRVFMLKLPANSRSSPELKKTTQESKTKSVSTTKPPVTKAMSAVSAAAARAISSPTESRPQNEAVLILQPLIVLPPPMNLPDIAMPTITMVAPAPAKERKVFDVGSIQKVRSMPKISDPGPLPEPPELMVSTNVIRPRQLNVLFPKLPVYTAPLPMQTIQAPDLQAVSAGGTVVEMPTNLVVSSSKAIPARETITLPAVIIPPKGGTGTDVAGGQAQLPSSVDGVAAGSIGQSKSREAAVGSEKANGPAEANVKPELGGGTGGGKVAGNAAAEVSAPIRIVHPVNGRHNVTIVQSGLEQILPEARGLLKGDPVYTVYLKVGWTKEWVMHYCLPREGPAAPKQVGGVVSLSSPKEVLPPYPIITLAPLQRLASQLLEIPGTTISKRAPQLFSGYLNTKGELEGMKREGGEESVLGEMILKALDSWKMRPATRGDEATRVQVILVVPVV